MAQQKGRKPRSVRLTMLAGAILLVAGVALAGFPFAAMWVSANAQVRVGEEYTLVANTASEERFLDAVYANEAGDLAGAAAQVTLAGVDAIARLHIPTIDVDLPVYPTSSDADLKRGAGHLEGTHTPVGGSGTHSAITAHSGMPTARMFDHLNRLEPGDLVIVEVLGQTLVYEVTGSVVDTPQDGMQHLQVQPGEDLLTLVTCTPYGVNTHRLLVTAQRVEVPEESLEIVKVSNGPPLWPWLIVSGLVAAGSTAGLVVRKRSALGAQRAR